MLIKQRQGAMVAGNTLAYHLCGRGSISVMAVSGKAGSACRWSAVYSTEP